MAPETGTALLVLVAFVLPGFVALLIGERTHVVPVHNRTPFELLLVATYYSVVCWGIIALASWPFEFERADLRRMYREESLGQLAALGLVAVLIVPALVATAARLWQRSERLRPRVLKALCIHEGHSIPTAWDDLFRRRRPALVRAVLSDGRVVAGYYGSQSFPGYGTESQDLLLETRWVLDGDHGSTARRWALKASGYPQAASSVLSCTIRPMSNRPKPTVQIEPPQAWIGHPAPKPTTAPVTPPPKPSDTKKP